MNLKEKLSLSELVKDSINHLINDLGKDNDAEDFADDVINDIENNYDVDVDFSDPLKYKNWASEVACEVSRQLNESKQLTKNHQVRNYKDFTLDLDENVNGNVQSNKFNCQCDSCKIKYSQLPLGKYGSIVCSQCGGRDISPLPQNGSVAECPSCKNKYVLSQAKLEYNVPICDTCGDQLITKADNIYKKCDHCGKFINIKKYKECQACGGEPILEDYSKQDYSWEEINGEVVIFLNDKEYQRFPSMEAAIDAGWVLDEMEEEETILDESKSVILEEKEETIDLHYDGLEFTQYGEKRDVDDWDEWEVCREWDYEVSKNDLYTFIFESCIEEEDFPEAFEDDFDPNNEEDWAKFEDWLDDNFDTIYSKYEEKILKNWEEFAIEEASEYEYEHQYDYDEDDYNRDDYDYPYDQDLEESINKDNKSKLVEGSYDLPSTKEEAIDLRHRSDAYAIFYGFNYDKDKYPTYVEPEEYEDKSSLQTRLDYIVKDYKNAKESDFVFYVLYKNNTLKENNLKWNVGSNKLVSPDSQEYANLVDLAKLLQERSPNGYEYRVEKTYEDYGAGMQWYTIICDEKNSWGKHQVLNTKQWLDLANGKPVEEVYQDVVSNEYFQDKEKQIKDMNYGELFDSLEAIEE